MLKMEEGYVWNKQMKWLKCSGRAKDANANLVGYFVVEIRYAKANAKLAKHSHLSFLEAFFLVKHSVHWRSTVHIHPNKWMEIVGQL